MIHRLAPDRHLQILFRLCCRPPGAALDACRAAGIWLADASTAFAERRYRRSRGIPSAAAWQEALDCYAQPACLASLRRLVRRRGLPDWENPGLMTEEEVFHPFGVLAAHVQWLLENLMSQPAPSFVGPLQVRLSKTSPSQAEQARCWLWLLSLGQPMPVLAAAVRRSNLWLATAHALRLLAHADVGFRQMPSPAAIVAGAVAANIVSASSARRLLAMADTGRTSPAM